METRVYGKKQEIDQEEVKRLYKSRIDKVNCHIDAPVVLCSDTAPEKAELWTKLELQRWFPYFELDDNSTVFELGFGTGRMTKYITPCAKEYVGIDYVLEFVDLVKNRADIVKKENTKFYHYSFREFLKNNTQLNLPKFNRFFLSGGVFLYMNDDELQDCIGQLLSLMDQECVMYISEPVAIEERLTLNSFYSENIGQNYSAIYRTVKEYQLLFKPLLQNGFTCTLSQLFFEEDIKDQKETKQWLFILKR